MAACGAYKAKAKTKASFSQRLRRLREWAKGNLPQGPLLEAVLKLCRAADDRPISAILTPKKDRSG